MKKIIIGFFFPLICLGQGTMRPQLLDFKNVLNISRKWTNEKIIVDEVLKQNKRKISLKAIKEIDIKWKKQKGNISISKTLMTNECAGFLNQLGTTHLWAAEIFVMDNQGANVCQNKLTSDYWQGDEDKWIKSFNSGVGKEIVAVPKYDDSTHAILVHISQPIKYQNQTIGVLTVGVNLDALIIGSSKRDNKGILKTKPSK